MNHRSEIDGLRAIAVVSVYYDDDHLSIKGSEIINNLILNKIENIK